MQGIERGILVETNASPVYSKPFFEIQLALAEKIADLLQQPIAQVLLRFTAFYRIFGLDWSLDPANPVWQNYTQELQIEPDKGNFTYQFYLQRYPTIPKFTDEEHWGCFAFDYNTKTRAIKLHFSDQDKSGYGPLSSQRISFRNAELRTMFQHIQQKHPDATLVLGGSWLYNWESYKRLFPQPFVQSARKQEMPALYGRALWNQFLRRGWSIHQETVSLFLQQVGQLERVEDYPHCFPYPVLLTEAPIHLFYEFFSIV
jgi:hypothetical protein